MEDSNARSWMSCLGWGCLAVVVVSVLAIGGCVAWVYQGGKGAHTVAETYLAAVEEGRFEDAFATLGAGFTVDRDLEAFIAFEKAARTELGNCGEWAARGTSFNREDGRSLSRLRFFGECDSGTATVSFSIEEVAGEWVIQDIRYNEPPGEPVDRAERCPGCAGAVPPGASFCPNCGAKLGEAGAASGGDGAGDSTALEEGAAE
ncbi:MAG: zinc ribbon domain-containing protein [Thermoanaerobaculales bacterium]|nr:zinc ribbon domain-containing protein [Thermoanaerobaculales bacterium]